MAPLIRKGRRSAGLNPLVDVRSQLMERLARDRDKALNEKGYGVPGGEAILRRFGWIHTLEALEAGETVTVQGADIVDFLPRKSVDPYEYYTI